MRCHQDQGAHPQILPGTGIDHGDRCAIAVTDQDAVFDSGGIEKTRQHVEGITAVKIQRTRQRDGRG